MGRVMQSQSLGWGDRVGVPAPQNITSLWRGASALRAGALEGWSPWLSVAKGNPTWAFQVACIVWYLRCPACFYCHQDLIFHFEKPNQKVRVL